MLSKNPVMSASRIHWAEARWTTTQTTGSGHRALIVLSESRSCSDRTHTQTPVPARAGTVPASPGRTWSGCPEGAPFRSLSGCRRAAKAWPCIPICSIDTPRSIWPSGGQSSRSMPLVRFPWFSVTFLTANALACQDRTRLLCKSFDPPIVLVHFCLRNAHLHLPDKRWTSPQSMRCQSFARLKTQREVPKHFAVVAIPSPVWRPIGRRSAPAGRLPAGPC
jgi:hypothetical protein